MARKKKARLSHKKRSGATEKQTPEGISMQKFVKLVTEYASFLVEDENHEQHEFRKNDVAYIRHQDLNDDIVVPETDYWIGIIQEIRADSPHDVWVRVRWFWSPQEAAEVIRSFDPTICGKYEKLASDNCDIISVHCFVCHVNVKRFDENSISQVSIGDNEWFYRYELLYVAKRITPKVAHVACPICKVPYTPGMQKTLHFCPRPGCRTFYHRSCLVKGGYVDEVRPHKVIETWPSVDRTIPLEGLCVAVTSPPKKRPKMDYSMLKETETDLLRLTGIPEQLIAIARQPIVRGTLGGSIVGNVGPVVAARQFIFNALMRDVVIPDDWETMIDVSAASVETGTFPSCTCPNCYSAI